MKGLYCANGYQKTWKDLGYHGKPGEKTCSENLVNLIDQFFALSYLPYFFHVFKLFSNLAKFFLIHKNQQITLKNRLTKLLKQENQTSVAELIINPLHISIDALERIFFYT